MGQNSRFAEKKEIEFSATDEPLAIETRGADPGPNSPRYISACFSQSWTLATWKKSDKSAEVKFRPAKCCSWRHVGPCAKSRAAEDYKRIAAALANHDRSHIAYLVLTLDPKAWDGEGWLGVPGQRRERVRVERGAISQAFDALSDRWHVLRQSIVREHGKIRYVSTVEVHKSGWPHLNVIIVSESLANAVTDAQRYLRGWDKHAGGREAARMVLGGMLESAGFGPIAFIECANKWANGESDALAAYVSKLAAGAGETWNGEQSQRSLVSSMDGRIVAEIAKLSQIPYNAPKNFRRLRSSKGFLPPVEKDEDATGMLLDASGQELGHRPEDAILAQAEATEPKDSQERLDILAKIGLMFESMPLQQAWAGDDGRIAKAMRRRIIKLLAAASVCYGFRDGKNDEEIAEEQRERLEYLKRRGPLQFGLAFGEF